MSIEDGGYGRAFKFISSVRKDGYLFKYQIKIEIFHCEELGLLEKTKRRLTSVRDGDHQPVTNRTVLIFPFSCSSPDCWMKGVFILCI